MIWLEGDWLAIMVENVVLPAILSTVATLIYVIKCGWHGLLDFLAKWAIASFTGVLAHWTALHYGITGALNAVIISMSALISHMLMEVLFNPQIMDAIKERLLHEIKTRGLNRQKGGE